MTDEQKEARRQAMWEAGMDEVSELEREETEVKDDALDGDVSGFPFPVPFLLPFLLVWSLL